MAKAVFDDLLERLRETQRELDRELDRLLEEGRAQFSYQLQRGKVVFEHSVRPLLRRQRIGLWRYILGARLSFILSAPLIYGMILPFVILDLSITLYQRICFPIYRIPVVRRAEYFVMDRHRLPYLNLIERLNCVYCSYGNQVLEYAREIAARTEHFWCPIKHSRRTQDPHSYTQSFFSYGDAVAYREGLKSLRAQWQDARPVSAKG